MAGFINPIEIEALVIVVRAEAWNYDVPTEPFPILRRASFIRVIMDAVVGADAEVPNTRLNSG